MSSTIDDVLDAHDAVIGAQERMRELAACRDQVVRDALASGVGAVPLAEALGVNRQRVYAMAAGKAS